MHNRGTTLIPTAEPDNNAIGNYPTGGGGGGYGAFDEAGYALDGMKVRYMSNVYEGFLWLYLTSLVWKKILESKSYMIVMVVL